MTNNQDRAPPPLRHLHDKALGQECQQIPLQRPETLDDLARVNEVPAGHVGIPDEAKVEVQALKEELDLFLGQQRGEGMEQIALGLRITRLVINGHIPLPCTLTAAVEFLGTYDTTSLPLAVLMSPAMGETRGRRSGLSRRKTQARLGGWGHEAAPGVSRQPPSRRSSQL